MFSPVVLLGGAGMLLVALVFIVYALWNRLGWNYLAFGAVMWIVTVAVKFALAVPFNATVYRVLAGGQSGGFGALLFDLYVGLLTGVTEVLIVGLVLRYTRLGKVVWERVLAFGMGFGAVEAFLLGLSSLATMLVVLLAPQAIPAQALSGLAIANNVLFGLAPIVERFFAMWIHIFTNALIFFGAVRMQLRWFWAAFAYKSLVDAFAAWGQLAGMTATVEQIWVLEAVVIVFGVLGWLGTRWVHARYPCTSV